MKRIISWVLSLVMILGMVPAVAFLAVESSAAESATYTYVQQKPADILSADNGTIGAWYNNSSTFVTTEGSANYIEIVEEGHNDAGALHVYQDNVANNDMSIGAFLGGQAAGTYTLRFDVKGALGVYSDQTCKFYVPGFDGQISNLTAKLNTLSVADWTTVTYEGIEISSDFYYLIFSFSKYNWAADIYIDNVQLINSSGVNVLGNAGNFCTLEEVTASCEDTNQWPDDADLDTTVISGAYGNTLTDAWTPMYPAGAADEGTWGAWDESHYGAIAADGYKDAGSLHLVSIPGKNTGIAINAGMIAGETYTLGFYAKGTVNTGKVLGMYANGDGTIIADTASFGAGWNYYEHTFTAGLSQINLVAADWGWVDILIDNITLKNSAGVDLLSGCGDFYTEATKTYYTVMQEKTASIIPADNGTIGAWYNNGSTFVTTEGSANYIEIVADGSKDAGALHVYQDNVANNDMSIGAFLGGQPAGTYTIKLYVKGDLGLMDQTCKFYIPGFDGQSPNLHTKLGTTDIADWTEVTYEINATSEFYYFIFSFSKYNWESNLYVDNIQLINASGVNVLGNAGNFCTLEEVTVSCEDTDQWPDDTDVATDVAASAYAGALADAWTPMYPSGNPEGTFSAWDGNHYAEIVANGYKDAGSLHMVSCPGNNTGLAISAGMIAGETYTLGFYAKGTVNTGKVLGMYANGDGTIISDTASFKDGWNYYEHTFTAGLSQINIVAADWGYVDIYLDNITLKNSAGADILSGNGNFYRDTAEAPEEPTEPEITEPEVTEPEVTEPAVEGLAVISNSMERAYRWYWNGVTYEETDHSKVEISAQGANDTGSLHIWQSSAAPSDTVLGLVTTMASDLENGSYTLSMDVKGTFYNTEGFYVHPQYGGLSDEQFAYLSVNKTLKDAPGVTDIGGGYTTDGWINLQWTLPANPEDGENGFMFLTLQFSKYNVGEYFIDNIQVLDPNGNDVLGGAGSFMDSGSEYFPIILPSTGAEILNSNTMYYQVSAGESNVSVSNHVESGITCGDQNFTVTHNGVTQAASNKNVTMQMTPAREGEPIVFAITSTVSSLDIPSGVFEMMQRAGEFNIYDVKVTATSCSHSYSDWDVTAAPTYTVAGSQSKTCSLCGEIVTEEIPVLANPVTGWNITLKDNIGVNFVMALADTDVVAVTVNGNAVDCTVADGKLSIDVAAAQMTDEIAISVNGLPLANTYSVRKYADTILADDSKSDCHELVKNMLVYGGAAQTYFGYKTSNLASSGIEVTAAVPTGEVTMDISGSVRGIQFYGASLVHDTKIAVRFYFTGSIEGLTFSQGTPVQKGDMYYVEIADICPQDLDQDIVISVTNGNNTLTVTYSALDYIIRMYTKGGNSAPLVQALYGYYLAAEAYTA